MGSGPFGKERDAATGAVGLLALCFPVARSSALNLHIECCADFQAVLLKWA